MKYTHSFLMLGLILTVAACTSEETAGEGNLLIEAGGGSALQSGFPYTEGGVEYAFVDGWALQFTRYVVVIGDVRLTRPDSEEVVGSWDGPAIIDLKKNSGTNLEVVTIENLPAIRLDVEFEFQAATDVAENRNADADVVAEMVENGYSMWVEGDASKDGESVHFLLRLFTPTHYYQCINGKDQTQGIAIEANKTTGVFIYAHALHLFWDTLAAGDEDLRFDSLAAVAGVDDDPSAVTETELANQDLTDLRDADGEILRDTDGDRVFYNDGGILPPNSLTLKTFLEYAARYGVHFNGVGLCLSRSMK